MAFDAVVVAEVFVAFVRMQGRITPVIGGATDATKHSKFAIDEIYTRFSTPLGLSLPLGAFGYATLNSPDHVYLTRLERT